MIQLLLSSSSSGLDNQGEGGADDTSFFLREDSATLAQLSRTANFSVTASKLRTTRDQHSSQLPQQLQQQHRLLQIVNGIDFEEEDVQTPNWEVFDVAQVGKKEFVFYDYDSFYGRNFGIGIFRYICSLLN